MPQRLTTFRDAAGAHPIESGIVLGNELDLYKAVERFHKSARKVSSTVFIKAETEDKSSAILDLDETSSMVYLKIWLC